MKINSYKNHTFKVTCGKCNTKIEFEGKEARDYKEVQLHVQEWGWFVFIDCPVCKTELSVQYGI